MNTQSNAIPDAPAQTQRFAPTVIPASRLMYWSVQRELWENRSIYLAPLAVAGLILLGFLINMLQPRLWVAVGNGTMHQRQLAAQPYEFAGLLIMGTTFVVAIFYCLDALHGERRDRSILFWKSLPVSDLMTVLSKASIPIVVLPLLTFAITVVTQWIMLLMESAVFLAKGQNVVATLWSQLSLTQMWMGLLYHLVTVHSLWYAPIFCWLLLVSAWARRAPILWAALPVLAIALVERIAFDTSHFATMLMNRMGGGAEAMTAPGGTPMDPTMTHLTPEHFLSSAGLWIGLLVAAAFLAGAVRLRRSQGPI
jgi:ABC-2 type transport system permease protein